MHLNNLAMHPGYTPGRSPPTLEGRAAAPCITLHWESIKN